MPSAQQHTCMQSQQQQHQQAEHAATTLQPGTEPASMVWRPDDTREQLQGMFPWCA